MKSQYCLITTVILLSCVLFFFPGCRMLHLYSESKELEKISELIGVVEAPAFQGKPIVIVFLSVDPTSINPWKAVVARTVLSRPGPFHFYAPSGIYHIGAFEDLNENWQCGIYSFICDPFHPLGRPRDGRLRCGQFPGSDSIVVRHGTGQPLPGGYFHTAATRVS